MTLKRSNLSLSDPLRKGRAVLYMLQSTALTEILYHGNHQVDRAVIFSSLFSDTEYQRRIDSMTKTRCQQDKLLAEPYLIHKADESYQLLQGHINLGCVITIPQLTFSNGLGQGFLELVHALRKSIFSLLTRLSQVANLKKLMVCQGVDLRHENLPSEVLWMTTIATWIITTDHSRGKNRVTDKQILTPFQLKNMQPAGNSIMGCC